MFRIIFVAIVIAAAAYVGSGIVDGFKNTVEARKAQIERVASY